MKESKVKDYFERIWSLYGNNPAHLLAALVRGSTFTLTKALTQTFLI